ncbi:MAG: NAD-dependent protein deacylase [Thermoplasmatales archaeon]|nr:MAG: NAD-dependent protein deacylase [Thermoplasmatales archaeon]
MDKKISELKKIIAKSNKIVAFTGAGFSAESGISTFRGTGGLWSKYDPNIYANINIFMQNSTYYWNFFRDERYPVIKKAKPNNGHYALVELEKRGKIYRVITQNIDGLHQEAGQSDVIELHGNTRKINCLSCSKTYNMDDTCKLLKKELPPKCSCGGNLKPGTVLFGEPLPQGALDTALLASKNCDLFLVLGSSLVVYPAASMPMIAKKSGAALVIVNIDPTPMDDIADLIFRESASKVLSKLI